MIKNGPFFEAFILEKFSKDYSVYDKDFSFLFNSYYNNAGDRMFRANRGNMTRPDVNEVYQYRSHINEQINVLLKQNSSQELKIKRDSRNNMMEKLYQFNHTNL